MKDEGRPLGAGLQEQAPNRLELHWSRAIVVSVNCATKLRMEMEDGLPESACRGRFHPTSSCCG